MIKVGDIVIIGSFSKYDSVGGYDNTERVGEYIRVMSLRGGEENHPKGFIVYHTKKGKLHNEAGPAKIFVSETLNVTDIEFYLNGWSMTEEEWIASNPRGLTKIGQLILK